MMRMLGPGGRGRSSGADAGFVRNFGAGAGGYKAAALPSIPVSRGPGAGALLFLRARFGGTLGGGTGWAWGWKKGCVACWYGSRSES